MPDEINDAQDAIHLWFGYPLPYDRLVYGYYMNIWDYL